MSRIFIIGFVFLLCLNLSGQKLVADTVIVDFKPDTLIPCHNYKINKIVDNRTGNPKIVSYTSRKKLVLIPVDVELTTRLPLAKEILPTNTNRECDGRELNLEIEHFEIVPEKRRFGTIYLLNADILVYSDSIAEQKFLGTLVYGETFNAPKGKKSRKDISEAMMNKWHTNFKLDLLSVANYNKNDQPPIENFFTQTYKKPYFLNTTVAAVVGFNFWQIEGEIYTSRPETEKTSFRQAGIVRYTNTPDFDAISFGKKSAHNLYRRNDNFGFDINFNVLVGLNRWKKIDELKPKLEQLIHISLSSVQCFAYEKKNQSGLMFRAGIYENVYYIIYKPAGFHFGLYGAVGYKF